jgi:hypothetical protein
MVVENRSIRDNVLLASEILHHMKCNRGKVGEVELKVHVNKAYDRVSWQHVKDMMRHMRFHEKLVNWTRLCMESVKYNVQVIG